MRRATVSAAPAQPVGSLRVRARPGAPVLDSWHRRSEQLPQPPASVSERQQASEDRRAHSRWTAVAPGMATAAVRRWRGERRVWVTAMRLQGQRRMQRPPMLLWMRRARRRQLRSAQAHRWLTTLGPAMPAQPRCACRRSVIWLLLLLLCPFARRSASAFSAPAARRSAQRREEEAWEERRAGEALATRRRRAAKEAARGEGGMRSRRALLLCLCPSLSHATSHDQTTAKHPSNIRSYTRSLLFCSCDVSA